METIKFNILDWSSYHEENEKGKKEFSVRIFGRTDTDKTIFVKVKKFTPYFYVEIPDFFTKQHIEYFINYLNENVSTKDKIKKYNIVNKKKCWGYTNNKNFKFLQLIFTNYITFKKYDYLLQKKLKIIKISPKPYKYNLYESNIEPLLRLIHIRNINSTGWVSISKYEQIGEETNCDINISTKWTNLNRLENTSIAPFIIASYDIECTSGDGSFPQADRKTDKIIQIGTTFSRYGVKGEKICFYKNLITLGQCDKIEGVDVESYKTEKEVLIAWNRLINRINPDIITGYNIFGFDEQYLLGRSKILNIEDKFNSLSRFYYESCEFVTKKLSSSALGDNLLHYYNDIGRVKIDLMKVVQRDFKLGSYKLDNVASHFIKNKIEKINYDNNILRIYSTFNDLQDDSYISILIDDGLAPSKLNDLKFQVIKKNNLKKEYKEIFIESTKLSDDIIDIIYGYNTYVDIEEYEYIEIKCTPKDYLDFIDFYKNEKYKVYWCMVKNDVSPQDIFRLQEGSDSDRAIIGKYCIKDCELVNILMDKLEILTNNIGMANVCHVPLNYIFTRGQGIKIFSLVSKKCRMKDYVIPVIKKPNNVVSDGALYEGAFVFEPKPGIYFNPITTLDYASLYPMSMIEKNLSLETLLFSNYYKDENTKIHHVIYNNTKCPNPTYIINKKCPNNNFHCTEIHGVNKNSDGYQKIICNIPGCTKIHCKTLNHCTQIHCVNKDCDEKHEHIECNKPCCTELHCKTHCEYAEGETKGIIPEILMDLLNARSEKKKLMEIEKNNFKKNIYNGLQLAYKITANSLYGQTGALTSPISQPHIAASTTTIGKERLKFAQKCVEQKYNADVIYGDTDSIFIKFKILDDNGNEDTSIKALEKSINLGQEASNYVNSLLPKPHNLEYEKVYWPFCIISKKRYVGNLYTFNTKKFYQNSMGIVLKRRDNADIVKIIVGGLVNILLNEQNVEKALKFTKKSIKKLLKGKYNMSKFIITKTLRAEYKVPEQITHKVLADRMAQRDPGNKPQVNDRIPFVYVQINEKKKNILQGERVEHPDYVIKNNLKIDYLFYLTNQIMKPALQFLELVDKNSKNIFTKYINKEENKRKGLKEITKFFKISKDYEDNDSFFMNL